MARGLVERKAQDVTGAARAQHEECLAREPRESLREGDAGLSAKDLPDREATVEISPENAGDSVAVRVQHLGFGLVGDGMPGKHDLLRPGLVLAHDDALVEGMALPQ